MFAHIRGIDVFFIQNQSSLFPGVDYSPTRALPESNQVALAGDNKVEWQL